MSVDDIITGVFDIVIIQTIKAGRNSITIDEMIQVREMLRESKKFD